VQVLLRFVSSQVLRRIVSPQVLIHIVAAASLLSQALLLLDIQMLLAVALCTLAERSWQLTWLKRRVDVFFLK